MIHLTGNEITGVKLNSKNILKVYMNSKQIWPQEASTTITVTGDGLIYTGLVIGNTYTVTYSLVDNTPNRFFGGGKYVFAGDNTDYQNYNGPLTGTNNYYVSEEYSPNDNQVNYSGSFTFTAATTDLYVFWTLYGGDSHSFSSGTVSISGATTKTADPIISYDYSTATVSATGAGTVLLYVNGSLVSNPYTFTKTTSVQSYTVTATAQESGKLISNTVSRLVSVPAIKNYLCFQGTSSFTFTNANTNTLYYSYDQNTWTLLTNSNGTSTIPLSSSNNKVYLKGTNTNFGGSSNTGKSYFTITSDTDCSGNIMSITDGDDFENALSITSNYAFCKLFNNCTGLKSLPELPATTISEYCYRQMFGGCTRLTDISDLELPATTLARGCYSLMFQDCSGITDASFTLPALRGTINMYSAMFRRCTSLTEPPVIAITSLTGATYAMNSMFEGCTSLERSPVLRSNTLFAECYTQMFDGCTNLKYIYALFVDKPTTSYTNNWVRNVSSAGQYYKNPNATYTTRGNYGIPNNWTVYDYSE